MNVFLGACKIGFARMKRNRLKSIDLFCLAVKVVVMAAKHEERVASALKSLDLQMSWYSPQKIDKILRRWRQLLPQIVITKPRTDLCWHCQQNSKLIVKATNKSVEEKSKVQIILAIL